MRRSVLENAAFGLLLHGTPRREAFRRAEVLLKRVGLWEKAHRPARGLSGGEAVRLALATHDLFQARRLADWVLFLHLGQVVEAAPASRFFQAPKDPRSQALLEGRLF